MSKHRRLNRISGGFLAVACSVSALSAMARADVIYETDDPFGSPFGVLGFDVFIDQSVAVRFTPADDFALDRVSMWLWNNDTSGGEPPIIITLRNDHNEDGASTPGDEIFESWQMHVPNTNGFNPTLFAFDSMKHPALQVDTIYWIVAESNAQPQLDPVWALSFPTIGYSSTTDFEGDEWEPASEGPVQTLIVEGTPDDPASPGDLDGDGDVDAADLAALLGNWGACADPKDCPADLDGDGTVGASDLAILLGNWG